MLFRAIPRVFVPALAVLVAATGCDRKSASALAHADVPPLSVPVQAAPLAASAPATSPATPHPAASPDGPPGAHAASNDAPAAERADEEPSVDDEPAHDEPAHASHRTSRRRRRGQRERATSHARAKSVSAGRDVDGAEADLHASRVAVARRVAHREPVGALTSMHTGDLEKLAIFVEITNPSRVASTITVALLPDAGGSPREVTLDVGPEARFRTWANLRAPRSAGSYHVLVRDDRGRVIGRSSFQVTP